jgi:hypothetical protein
MAREQTEELRKVISTSIQIRCRWCEIKDTCPKRAEKESYENKGWMTRCTITPNKTSGKKKISV